jgi:hypothetical protein
MDGLDCTGTSPMDLHTSTLMRHSRSHIGGKLSEWKWIEATNLSK